jgi:transposase
MDTEVLKYSVGIDVSKDELETCFKSLQKDQETKVKGTRKFPNTKKGFLQVDNWIDKRYKDKTISLVVEATGVYHEKVSYYLHKSRVSCGKVHHLVL